MMFLFLAVIYGFSLYHSQAQDCPRGTHDLPLFGPSCEYMCHCGTSQCNRETGDCPDNGECEGGWMGSGCQNVNIAYGKTVNSSHLDNTSTIVDGRKDSCPDQTQLSIKPAYVTVSLGREVKITEVNIVFSNSDNFRPFPVSVLDGDQTYLCGSVDYTNGQKEYFVNCNRTFYGQYINITYQRSTGLEVCEIQVPAGRNLAYSKPASQSSLEYLFYASGAVDGLIRHKSQWLTCTHRSNSHNPWWLLDLEASVLIEWFRIYNREDNGDSQDLNERLKNFRISLSEDNLNFTQYYQDQSNGTEDPPLLIEVSLMPDVLARFVKIDLEGKNRILSLCEVQIFGECAPGYYGGKCNKSCINCKSGDCDKITGKCRSCEKGKQGDFCRKNCSDYLYGDNCTQRCGRCLGSDVCDKVGGLCLRGCSEGWNGDKCLQACDENYYGNCTTRCGHCRDSAVCDKVNCSCPFDLCSGGWEGVKCDTECDSLHYGQNCEQPCGHCLNNTCDRFTGNCFKDVACEPGWQGSRCDVSLNAGNSGINFGVVGGSVGAAVAIVVIIVVVVVFIILKRRRKHESPSSNAPSTRNFSRQNEAKVVYENSMFLDINDSMPSVQKVINEDTERSRMPITKNERETVVSKAESEPYYNVGRALPAGTITLSKFWDYVQEKFLDEKYFSEEFENLPSGPQRPTTVAQRPENKNKNRYKQLYAYDANNYINASFVDGFSCEKMYIASQGTTKDNVNDFWRILWQHDVEKIVMLTGLFEGGRHKCELYWPEKEGKTSTFGSVAVRLIDTDAFADYEIRTLEMSVGNKSKHLTQFHYTAWPDKGVPKAASSIVQFWNRVNRLPTKKPIVVHCSAGIGRTGTYIALDYLVNQAKTDGHLNVLACVSNLRRQRVNLVQTEEQYIFLHETLVEALMLSGTATSSDKFAKVYQEQLEVDGESGKLKLQLEYERLQNEATNHETLYAAIKMNNEEGVEVNSNHNEYSAAKKPENRAKNRYDNILPVERHRVSLYTHVSGGNDYINAVLLPSHRQRQGFILTQKPLTGTVTDFWRMIHDFEIATIIMFDLESSKTHDIVIYLPNDGEACYGPFSIRFTKEKTRTSYIERTLSFSLNGHDHGRTVRQFQFNNWAENSDVPGSTESLLQLLDAVETWQKETAAKPVVVHCVNGAQRSGLYCVMSTVLERLKIERDVAISHTIKRLRAIRQQIIPSYEQFRFCHECVLQYIKTFETYSNF